ncbi:hypothetical protein MNBD_ACTINO02-1891 [hydrothermal vent metagenome]|jgi:Flp pilus assembly pilin Flp|uniref:Flp pilus assembly protein, pilin Flp n=1 Tax=hydrothermal vent metagenome TaxID=652676 RepID=A0A3B0T1J0_9ZZZZ
MIGLIARWQAFTGTNERGASLVEYALLMAFIAVIAVAAVTFVGEQSLSNIEPLTEQSVWRP